MESDCELGKPKTEINVPSAVASVDIIPCSDVGIVTVGVFNIVVSALEVFRFLEDMLWGRCADDFDKDKEKSREFD
ncbi:hypothetical protein FOMG_07371 [Fusarium oxysporum f. sp. melonis 26406]|jgi:hypothetical protein|uniref:Uncharacterized protein n=2 Tax=Fusarium oxysporum TaxID=5507 RepID=W9IH37_FUSOX|nr:hypothetical protein FOYG_08783 [Fusarium oxysporum NRRL 32931]EXK40575.1 hypothetical protein FOMG_07371 [Fusarium oxysporum f. sp. melonis 26406]